MASITSRNADRIYPFEAAIALPQGGLTRPSKVMLMQLRSIDKRRIRGRHGAVAPDTMKAVDEALRIATGLEGI